MCYVENLFAFIKKNVKFFVWTCFLLDSTANKAFPGSIPHIYSTSHIAVVSPKRVRHDILYELMYIDVKQKIPVMQHILYCTTV